MEVMISDPSISKDLWINAINFVKSVTPTDNKIINKMKSGSKKKNPNFDVMGSFDGVEVCGLVGVNSKKKVMEIMD